VSAVLDAGARVADEALALEDLDVAYRVRGRDVRILRSVTLQVRRGEAYGLVGESGCGKSTAALAALGGLPAAGRVRAGQIRVAGETLAGLSAAELRRLRARQVSMVFQDAGRALNPALTVGRQITESFELLGHSRAEARRQAEAMLGRVQISGPARVMASYPHQLSGGMQQRAVIAMALAKDPALLVLDEPTTGLDATVEAEVLDLVAKLRGELASGVLLISHNLAVVRQLCDRVGVLYAGYLVEEGPADQVLSDPRHPYTAGLLRCLPRPGLRKERDRLDAIPGLLPSPGVQHPGCAYADRCALVRLRCKVEPPPLYDLGNGRGSRCHYSDLVPDLPRGEHGGPTQPSVLPQVKVRAAPMLDVAAVSKTYTVDGRTLHALRDVSLQLWPGETLGVVGESGSGKTTLARLLLGLAAPDQGGRITLDGAALPALARGRASAQVKALQIVFQNPDSALNRSHTVRHLIARTIARLTGMRGRAQQERLLGLVRGVRLAERYLASRPRQLSGGLKQRVAIARAFAGEPRLVVCDEPTSALDVSVQAAILNLLADLQAQQGVGYVFISHDLGVVRYLADRVAVLYLGRMMQLGPAEAVFAGPQHPYTEALLAAAPGAGGHRIRLQGEIPSPVNPPSGCVFHTRCPRKIGAICETEEPPLDVQDGNAIRCHIARPELPRGPALRDSAV
jgi:peptide/nickel transport system ATP-binding protein